jgi:hypothetical protein
MRRHRTERYRVPRSRTSHRRLFSLQEQCIGIPDHQRRAARTWATPGRKPYKTNSKLVSDGARATHTLIGGGQISALPPTSRHRVRIPNVVVPRSGLYDKVPRPTTRAAATKLILTFRRSQCRISYRKPCAHVRELNRYVACHSTTTTQLTGASNNGTTILTWPPYRKSGRTHTERRTRAGAWSGNVQNIPAPATVDKTEYDNELSTDARRSKST